MFASCLILLAAAHPVLAQAEIENAEPAWYFLLEIVGSIISVFALAGLLRISRIIGGAVGNLLLFLSAGTGFITIALLLRSYFEWTKTETFASGLAFEAALYLGLLVIFVGVELAIKRIKKISSSAPQKSQ